MEAPPISHAPKAATDAPNPAAKPEMSAAKVYAPPCFHHTFRLVERGGRYQPATLSISRLRNSVARRSISAPRMRTHPYFFVVLVARLPNFGTLPLEVKEAYGSAPSSYA